MTAPWRPHRKRGVHALHRRTSMMKLREFMWPSMGLLAWLRWVGLSMLRQAHNPAFVARGAALGVVVAFFPVLGTHTLILAVLVAVFRASFVAGMLTSMVANPWTLPFIWAASHKVGALLLGRHLPHVAMVQPDIFQPATLLKDLPALMENVLLPTTLGGQVLAWPLAVLVYALAYWRLRAHHAKQRS